MEATNKRVRPLSVPSWALLPYILLTFAITWSLIGFYIYFPEQAIAWFGEISGSHPIFFLATWSPAFAAFIVVTISSGLSGLKAFLSRIFLWKISWFWVTFLLFGVPLTFVAGALVKGSILVDPLLFENLTGLLGMMVVMFFLGPVEEFGWRGVAQPLLQRHMAPIWAGLIIGASWGIWHLPAFYLSGTVQSGWSFTPFFIGNVVLAVIVTPLFNASRGSILLPALFHFQLINPLWPDAQPYDTWFFVAVAAAIVYLNRENMFSRRGAVTDVIPTGVTARQ